VDEVDEVGEVDGGPTRAPRALVVGALVVLLVAGLREVEAWPLTAWRLFSGTRGDEQTGWALQTVDTAGEVAPFSLADLPVGYRLATWPLGDLPAGPSAEGDALCAELLARVIEAQPDTAQLRILRDRQRMERLDDGDWGRVHAASPVVSCRREATR
jgi:hypothetical protein